MALQPTAVPATAELRRYVQFERITRADHSRGNVGGQDARSKAGTGKGLVQGDGAYNGLHRNILLLLIPIFGAFMVNSFLSFAATTEFKITFLGIGPTEGRLLLILLNTAIIALGTGFMKKMLPFVPFFAVIALIIVVYRTQKYIWQIDMEDKRSRPM